MLMLIIIWGWHMDQKATMKLLSKKYEWPRVLPRVFSGRRLLRGLIENKLKLKDTTQKK
jgi:hypothetical protein